MAMKIIELCRIERGGDLRVVYTADGVVISHEKYVDLSDASTRTDCLYNTTSGGVGRFYKTVRVPA